MLHLVDTDDHWYDSDVRVTCCTLLPAYVWKATNCRVYSLIRHSWFAWAFVMFIGMIMTCFSKMMISLLLHSWSITNQARWLEERMNSVRATQSSHLKCYRLYACYVMLTIPDNDIFFFSEKCISFDAMCCLEAQFFGLVILKLFLKVDQLNSKTKLADHLTSRTVYLT